MLKVNKSIQSNTLPAVNTMAMHVNTELRLFHTFEILEASSSVDHHWLLAFYGTRNWTFSFIESLLSTYTYQ
jgi:hypothetical protein